MGPRSSFRHANSSKIVSREPTAESPVYCFLLTVAHGSRCIKWLILFQQRSASYEASRPLCWFLHQLLYFQIMLLMMAWFWYLFAVCLCRT